MIVRRLYTNNLKNRDFGKAAPQFFCSKRVAATKRQSASENKKPEAQPTQSKNDSSSCLCITLLFFLFCNFTCFASDMESKIKSYFFSPDITSLAISDWKNPTVEDYWNIQHFLKQKTSRLVEAPLSSRPFPDKVLNEEFYGWLTYRMGKIRFVKHGENPSFNTIHFNNDPNNKEKCVICYAGYPTSGSELRNYVRGIDHIIASLKRFRFDGHFIYLAGGWPSLKRGRLKFADVPYAFKPFLFEEARDLGYKNILWIDACSVPVKSLDPIFDFIEKNGLGFFSYNSMISWREFTRGYKYLMSFLNVSEGRQYEEVSSQIVGFNVTDPKAANLLNEWIKAAERKIPFLQSDEPPFIFLVNHLDLLYGKMPSSYYVETPCNTGNFSYWKKNPAAIIYHQYDFIDPNARVPSDLFNH